MKREEGYYWVKIKESENWQPTELLGSICLLIGDEICYEDAYIVEVGKRIVKK